MGKKTFIERNIFKIAKILNNKNIDFLICGGIAQSILIEPRATVDIDIIAKLKKAEFKKIKEELKKNFKDIFPHKNLMVFKKIKIWRIVIFEEKEQFLLDFLFLDNKYFSEILKRKVEIKLEGKILPIVSPEDLYILKSLSNREIDKWDRKKIKEKFKLSFDMEYVKKWLKILKG
ncbi:MAG: nucleotidyltransferase [Thermoanaerobaculia bacterium]